MNDTAIHKTAEAYRTADTARPRRSPEWPKYVLSAVILLAGGAIMGWLAGFRKGLPRRESDALLPLVQVAPVERFTGNLDLVVSGTVVPYREIRVGAEVPGRILKKFPICQAGNVVKKGTRLLEIDPQNLQMEIKTLDSELLQADKTMVETEEEIRGASKSLEIAKGDYQLQQSEFRRFENLKRSVSATELDQARRNLLNSQAQLTVRQNTYDMLLARKERLKASKLLIENRKERARLDLDRTVIVAPDDGVIVREFVEQGDYVTQAQQLFLFEDTSRAEIICNFTPRELAWLKHYATPESFYNPDTDACTVYELPRVEVDVFEQHAPAIRWKGILERFDGIGRNEMTKMIPCRIGVEQPIVPTTDATRGLVRGMYVKCRIVISDHGGDGELVAFPESGLRPGDFVWVVRDNRLKRIDLRVVDRSPVRETMSAEKLVVVELGNSGLQLGDQIVISPLPHPIDGGRVNLAASQTEEGTVNQAASSMRSDDPTVAGERSSTKKDTRAQADLATPRDRSRP
jgi:multidrug efflux pump subunit AcrA (membrane-fusion protein)